MSVGTHGVTTLPEHACRDVEPHRSRATRCQPASARRGTAPDLEDIGVPSVAEQADVSFVQPLGAPDELTVGAADAEKLSVRAVILVRIGIPPRPTGSIAGSRIDLFAAWYYGRGRCLGRGRAVGHLDHGSRPHRPPHRVCPAVTRSRTLLIASVFMLRATAVAGTHLFFIRSAVSNRSRSETVENTVLQSDRTSINRYPTRPEQLNTCPQPQPHRRWP